MTNIIYITDNLYIEDLLNEIRENKDSYLFLSKKMKEEEITLYFSSFHLYDNKKDIFASYIRYNKNTDDYEIILDSNQHINSDIIWNNSKNGIEYIYDLFEENNKTIYPSRKGAHYLCDNFTLYLATRNIQKKAILLDQVLNKRSGRSYFDGDNLLIKPIRGMNESGTEFMEKKDFESTIDEIKDSNIEYRFLIQENVDSNYTEGDKIIGDIELGVELIKGKPVYGIANDGNVTNFLKRYELNEGILLQIELILDKINFLKKDFFFAQFGYNKSENRWYFIDVDYLKVDEVSNMNKIYVTEKYKTLRLFFKEKLKGNHENF